MSSKTSTKTIELSDPMLSYTPMDMLPTNPNAVNLTRYIDQAGRVHLVYDPAEIIPDAGTVRTFRGQRQDPKTGNTVSNNGRLWNDFEFNGETFGECFGVIHRPDGSRNRPAMAVSRPAAKRLW